ncbi:Rhodanese-like domain protein [Staphylococcus aureus]|uniref:Rhodanese-like domain protein n=1 Tax=Staphylococcus aureus TaxID=1280 RepID=A0A380E4D3_STAAU|nr:Rhodanese-like domain protein [Staphylococcus aureus]
MSASLYIAIILVIAIIAYMIVQQILNKRAVKELDQMNSIMGLEKLKSSMLERKLTMTTVTLMGLAIFL